MVELSGRERSSGVCMKWQREYYLHKKVRSVSYALVFVCFKILSYLTVFLYSLGRLQQRGGGC